MFKTDCWQSFQGSRTNSSFPSYVYFSTISFEPSSDPSNKPSFSPSSHPSRLPSIIPSGLPTSQPTDTPSECVDDEEWLFSESENDAFGCSMVNSIMENQEKEGFNFCKFLSDIKFDGSDVYDACCVCKERLPSISPSISPVIEMSTLNSCKRIRDDFYPQAVGGARRTTSANTFVSKQVLVVQVTTLDGITTHTDDELSDYIFNRVDSMTSQFRLCSFGKLVIEPFQYIQVDNMNVYHGVLEIILETNIKNSDAEEILKSAMDKVDEHIW